MSEEPVKADKSEELPEVQAPSVAASRPVGTDAGFRSRAIIVGAATFVVVLGIVMAIFTLSGVGRTVAEPASEPPARENVPAEGGFDTVKLLTDGRFTMTLPPTGDQSVMFEYTIWVKVVKSRRQLLDELIDPLKKNMLSHIQEAIRQIIRKEDYLKLREEKLDNVKRHIQQSLNAMMDGKEVVVDVVFERWDVIP